jgi:hypothetical protein
MSDYSEKMMDAILSNSALTDGLTDDEAELVYKWASAQIDYLAPKISSDQQFDELRGTLFGLINTMSLVARRSKDHDAVWINEKLDDMDTRSRELDGPIATTELRHTLHDEKDRHEILLMLAQHYDLETPDISDRTTVYASEQKRSVVDNEGEVVIDLDEVFADIDSTAGRIAKDVMEALRNIASEAGSSQDVIEDVADKIDEEEG